jgi:hypothetical protein
MRDLCATPPRLEDTNPELAQLLEWWVHLPPRDLRELQAIENLTTASQGRNEFCWCGSTLKAKRCCQARPGMLGFA